METTAILAMLHHGSGEAGAVRTAVGALGGDDWPVQQQHRQRQVEAIQLFHLTI